MAATAYQSASPTVGATEYSFGAASTTLPTLTDIGAYQLTMEVESLALADEFLVQVYEKASVSGATKRLAESWLVTLAASPVWLSPTLVLGNGWDWTIKKLTGTDRTVRFTLWKL